MSEVYSMTGSKMRQGPAKVPSLRLVRDELDAVATEEKQRRTPIDDAKFRMGAEVTRILCMSGGNIEGAVDLIEQELAERLSLYAQQTEDCGND